MQTKMTWKVRVLSLVLICLALLALSLLTDISTIGAIGRFAWNAVMAALLELELAGRIETLPGSRVALLPETGF